VKVGAVTLGPNSSLLHTRRGSAASADLIEDEIYLKIQRLPLQSNRYKYN